MLALLENINVRIVERATVAEQDSDGEVIRRRVVRGYASPQDKEVVVGKRHHRGWAKANDMILTFIHELLHVAVPQASERWVRAHEMELFKDAALREATALKMLNSLLFPGNDA